MDRRQTNYVWYVVAMLWCISEEMPLYPFPTFSMEANKPGARQLFMSAYAKPPVTPSRRYQPSAIPGLWFDASVVIATLVLAIGYFI